jgi:E3 ubiquitin-protein ligase RFWD3
LFAKKIAVIDNSEEIRLQSALDEERRKVTNYQIEINVIRMELELQKKFSQKLELKLKELEMNRGASTSMNLTAMNGLTSRMNYRLFMEKNVEICKEIGCKVMAYGEKCQNLLISQKSTQSLFPGYGIRFLDVPSFRPASFIHLSTKGVKDVCYDFNNDLFVTATMDRAAKLFNINSKTVAGVFTPSEDPLWACTFDYEKDKLLYLGSQKGNTYVYDIRNSGNFIQEFKAEGDFSPVINICTIKVDGDFPFGGFLVCKLTSLWFYEYRSDETVDGTRLNVEGPFLSMSYNQKSGHVLISTRPNPNHTTCRLTLGKVVKLNGITAFETEFTFLGSRIQTGITKAAQIAVESDTIVTGYVQDVKAIALWSLRNGNKKLQSLPVQEAVHDMVPICVDHQTYVTALTDNKCRVYKLTTD